MIRLSFLGLIVVVVIFYFVSALFGNQDSNIEINNASWHKAVINNNEILAFLPTKIQTNIRIEDNVRYFPRFERTIYLTLNCNDSVNPVQYQSNPIDVCEPDFTRQFYMSFKLYGKNKLIYPYAWDISDNQKHIITNSMSGRAGMNRTFSHNIRKLGKSMLDPRREGRIHVKLPDYLDYSKQFGEPLKVDMTPSITLRNDKTAKIEWPKPYEVVYYQINAEMDDIVDMYLLRTNILYKYVFDGNIWTFKYAVRMPRTEPFEAIQKSNNLYILMEKFGIYKIDEFKAVINTKKTPEVTENISDDYSSITWGGFTEEDKDLDLIKAEKIMDLSYDYYVVDKDSNTGYVIADNYLYEIGNATLRIKMPEFRETESFLDAEAERMRATLEAIYFLKTRYEKTPDELLKVTPDSEIDKKLADEKANANNNGNADGGSDDDESESAVNKKNGDAENTANGSSDASATDEKNSSDHNSKNHDKNGKGDSDIENSDNSDPDPANTSDGTNTIIYITTGVGLLVLLTLVFILLVRKKRV